MGRGAGKRNPKERLTANREKAAYKAELTEIYQERDSAAREAKIKEAEAKAKEK